MSLIVVLIIILIIIPVCTLLHELGHVLPVLLLTKEVVEVNVGARPYLIKIKHKRFILNFHFNAGYIGFFKVEEKVKPLTKKVQAMMYAGGPVASCIFSILSFIIIFNYSLQSIWFEIIRGFGSYAALQFLFTAIPMIYPKWWHNDMVGLPSDGMRIRRLLSETEQL